MDGRIPILRVIFIVLAIIGFILFIINSMDSKNQLIFYKIQSSIHSDHKPSEPLGLLKVSNTYCGKAPTVEEAKEERNLRSSIAWPDSLVKGLPLKFSSHPANSYYVIQGPAEQHIGDQLVVTVHMHNFMGKPKIHGGDFLIARLHSPNLGAGVAGKVHDHNDGNYTVLFPLLWAGEIFVEITMVHPVEAVDVLKRLRQEQPGRVLYTSLFRSGKISETTFCNLCLPMNQQPLCNYTDPLTGEPWYCYKPQNLGCDTRINHGKKGYAKNLITSYEAEFFQSGVNLKVPIPGFGKKNVTVTAAEKGEAKVLYNYNTAGYYFNNTWKSLNGTVIKQFNDSSAITQCLRGKLVYILGDSTARQWFDYLTLFPDFQVLNLYSEKQAGPWMAVDIKNNILLTYRCHGPPIRFREVPIADLQYVANIIDSINGGPNTVIFVSVWAHLTVGPIEVYIRRLRNIRKAVLRLLNREPTTLVVIRSAALQQMNRSYTLFNNDWLCMQIDAVLRAMFKGINVQVLDAWEMTLAHHLPHDLHPVKPILKNMIDVFLSYICPVGKI